MAEEYVVNSSLDYLTLARKGVPSRLVTAFKERYGFTVATVATLLNVSEPSLYRWIKTDHVLDKIQTVKILELADLFTYGIDVLGTKDQFLQWLELSNAALGGLCPLELLEYPEGISKVRDVLGRIEYGVFS